MPRALHDLQPRVPHLRFQSHVGQPADLLRLARDGLVLVPKLEVPRLENGLEGVHGAAVSVPLERGEEEVQDVCVEARHQGLHPRSWVEDQVQRVLREEVSDLGDGFAEFRGRFGVIGDCLGTLAGYLS